MTSSVIANSDNTRKVYDIKVLRFRSKIESILYYSLNEMKQPQETLQMHVEWMCRLIRTCAMIVFMK